MPEPRTDETTIRVRIVTFEDRNDDVIEKACAVKELGSFEKENNNIPTSNIAHEYELGKRGKGKESDYFHFKEARINEQVTRTECKHCASRVAPLNRAKAKLAIATRPRITRREDFKREQGYYAFVNMHNNNQRVHIVNTNVNRIHKICIFIFYVLLNALCCVI